MLTIHRIVGRYEFTHALIQQTLFNELSTTRRVRLHARIVEVFEELYGTVIESYAVDLAYHSAEAEAMIDLFVKTPRQPGARWG